MTADRATPGTLVDDDDECRTCGERYDDCGDGYDGECPSCADKSDPNYGAPDDAIPLCMSCADAIGGAFGGPDAPYRDALQGEACGAADCPERMSRERGIVDRIERPQDDA